MRVGSLFSGYGGLDLAVGGELAWYSEIEPAACAVLEAHHPGVPNLGDITQVDWATVPPVDIITGGYPCQPFSQAGRRKGKNDERHLWPFVRNAIREMGPRYAILENVRGHLSLGFADVLADLADIGWNAEWAVIAASDIGAPHRRERLFIVAYPNDTGLSMASAAVETQAERHRHAAQGDWPSIADTIGRQDGWMRATTHSLYDSSQRGSELAPDTNGSSRRPTVGESEAQWTAGNNQSRRSDQIDFDWQQYEPAIRRWEHIIERAAPDPTIMGSLGRPRLNPVFVEWMMGLPQGWVTGHGLSAHKCLKMLGNGVVPQQANYAITQLFARIS